MSFQSFLMVIAEECLAVIIIRTTWVDMLRQYKTTSWYAETVQNVLFIIFSDLKSLLLAWNQIFAIKCRVGGLWHNMSLIQEDSPSWLILEQWICSGMMSEIFPLGPCCKHWENASESIQEPGEPKQPPPD